jgi:hypothetical protein
MHRIDNATAIAALPAPEPVGTPGFFTNGNRPAGLAPTRVDDNWLNTVQEEIANVVLAAGLQLSKVSNTQLYEAIQAIAYGANPDLSAYLPLSGGTLSSPGNLTVNGQLTVNNGDLLLGAGASGVITRAPGTVMSLGATGGGNVATLNLGADQVNAIGGLHARADLDVSGSLTVSGLSHLLSGCAITANLEVAGSFSVSGPLNAFFGGYVVGNFDVAGNLLVSGTDINGVDHGIIFNRYDNFKRFAFSQPDTRFQVWIAGLHFGDIQYTPAIASLTNIAPAADKDALAAIRAIELFAYDRLGRRDELGFLAAQMHTAIPEAATVSAAGDAGEPQYTLDWLPIAAYSVRAIQQLADRVEALERRPAPLPA